MSPWPPLPSQHSRAQEPQPLRPMHLEPVVHKKGRCCSEKPTRPSWREFTCTAEKVNKIHQSSKTAATHSSQQFFSVSVLNTSENEVIPSPPNLYFGRRYTHTHTHTHYSIPNFYLMSIAVSALWVRSEFLLFFSHFALTVPAKWEFTCRWTKIILQTCHFTHIVFINLLPPSVKTYDFLLQFTWKLLLQAFIWNSIDLGVVSSAGMYLNKVTLPWSRAMSSITSVPGVCFLAPQIFGSKMR